MTEESLLGGGTAGLLGFSIILYFLDVFLPEETLHVVSFL
jgi:hypothetical protein